MNICRRMANMRVSGKPGQTNRVTLGFPALDPPSHIGAKKGCNGTD